MTERSEALGRILVGLVLVGTLMLLVSSVAFGLRLVRGEGGARTLGSLANSLAGVTFGLGVIAHYFERRRTTWSLIVAGFALLGWSFSIR
jgi:hypothetical protein